MAGMGGGVTGARICRGSEPRHRVPVDGRTAGTRNAPCNGAREPQGRPHPRQWDRERSGNQAGHQPDPHRHGGTSEPRGAGLVASLARPGGNVTGLTNSAGPEIAGKHLQLLKEAAPKISHVAVLTYRANPMEPPYSAHGRDAGPRRRHLGDAPCDCGGRSRAGSISAFAMVAKARVDALHSCGNTPFSWTRAGSSTSPQDIGCLPCIRLRRWSSWGPHGL